MSDNSVSVTYKGAEIANITESGTTKLKTAGTYCEDDIGLVAQLSGGGGTDISLGITGASVGQIAKITAVDADGKPTAWEAVDMPSGGVGAWSITNALTNATTSNSASTVAKGGSYSATITAETGYALNTVTVTMGGVDITSTAYADGVITIAEVTGDVVITAEAKIPNPYAAVNWLDTVYCVGDNESNYNAWCPKTVAYDDTRGVIVYLQYHCTAHTSSAITRTLVTIDPYNPTEYTKVSNFPNITSGSVGGLVVENGTWTVYLADYRYRSTDGGATWEKTAVTTSPLRMYGASKIGNTLYCGDDYSTTDTSHNGWYYTSDDDGINWTQKVFDFASEYSIPCSEAEFFQWQGNLYATIRRESATGLLAKMVDGVWTVVLDTLPNVSSDASVTVFDDVVAIAAINRTDCKLVLATYNGDVVTTQKTVDFKGATASGDFHTPTYIHADNWQAVFFMMTSSIGSEYYYASNAALFGYKDGVSYNAPTYETESVSYSWQDIITSPVFQATNLVKGDDKITWENSDTSIMPLFNISKRLPVVSDVDEAGNVTYYGWPQCYHVPNRGSGMVWDLAEINGSKWVCLTELNAETIGSFDADVRGTLPIKIMGKAIAGTYTVNISGAQNIAYVFPYSTTWNGSGKFYRVKATTT